MDPGAAVRCLVGPLLAFVLTREVFVQAELGDFQPRNYGRNRRVGVLEGMEIKSDSASD